MPGPVNRAGHFLDKGGRRWDNNRKPNIKERKGRGERVEKLLMKRLVKPGERPEDPAVRRRCGTLSGGMGIALNLLLFLGKLLSGIFTGSIAVMADAFNNLSDAGSSVVTLIGFRMASRQADDDHPFGHGRMEYLSGFIVALAILLVGAELIKSSVEKIIRPEAVAFSPVAAAILIAAIAVKLWMFAFNRALGRGISSAAMAATATDSLTDAVATSVVLLGTLIAHFTQVRLDGWLGIVVAVFILRSGVGALKDTMDPLLGKSPDPKLVREIEEAVLAHPEVVGLHDLVIHDYGPGRSMMSFHAEVPATADVLAMHDAIDLLERELKGRFHIETVIHMDPIADDEATRQKKAQVEAIVASVDPRLHIHDFRMTSGPRHTNLIFDVVVPYRYPQTDEQARAALDTAIRAVLPDCYTVIEVDHSYTADRTL